MTPGHFPTKPVSYVISWLTGYHRLNVRYDRKATHFLGFLTLAAALTGYKKLPMARSAT
ncbi:hypothetical protein [Nocardia sp. NPDC049707]|uniref:hypothetical protein n=1 Tax=Nocardia sp. NPDC049707 TaxID=3154735 RepID=UPI00343B9CD5